jgi:alpha-glucosidase (family GH31 glycosyl hydrolase)
MFTEAKFDNASHPAFWSIYNHNANAQDVRIKTGGIRAEVTHYITGTGIFDFYLALDNANPEESAKSYQEIVGAPLLIPYWSLGWHQCRYGYRDTQKLIDVVAGYERYEFPLDVMWTDIDYMDRWRDFTYAKNTTFAGLDKFVENLHAKNMKYIPIIDAGIAIVEDEYPALTEGLKDDVFIKSPNAARDDYDKKNRVPNLKRTLFGRVWAGYAAFPDWAHPKAEQYWVDQMNDFYDELPFDGLWLDMNEVANFDNGCSIDEDCVDFKDSVHSNFVYTPGERSLEDSSLSIDGVHADGHLELDYHSLFGYLQGKATKKYFDLKNQRTFVISRSTFAGSGKYHSHWLGDNFASFDMLKYSIAGVMNFNAFGVPMTGSDICGFIDNTSLDLCEKWTLVGAFYPFSRNHNAIDANSQEPYLYPPSMRNNMKQAIQMKYSLARYYYSIMKRISDPNDPTSTLFKPMFFEFPHTPDVYEDIERNIMLGPAIKFSPIIDADTTSA